MFEDKITLIIPTHNRHKYLARILDYYSNSNFKIVVTDSTANAFTGVINKNVKYFHFSNEAPMIKLVNILSEVTTLYMCFCADDDFWVKDTLRSGVDFLDSNSDYACVQGRYITFNKKNNYVDYIPAYLSGNNLIINDEDVSLRIKKIMSNYMPVFYALHRVEYIKAFFSDAIENEITHPILSELMLTFYAIASGKYFTLHQLSYARDHDAIQSDVDRTTLDILIKKPKYFDEIARFKRCIVNYMNKKQGVNANKILEEAIAIYVCKIQKKKTRQSVYGIKKIIRYILPLSIIIKIKSKRAEKLKFKRKLHYGKMKGYPGVDEKTNNAWEEISSFIIKHDIK